MFFNSPPPPTPPTPRPLCCGGLSQRPGQPVHPLSPAVLQPTSACRITLQSSIYRPGLSTNGLGCSLELYGMRISDPIQLGSKCKAQAYPGRFNLIGRCQHKRRVWGLSQIYKLNFYQNADHDLNWVFLIKTGKCKKKLS